MNVITANDGTGATTEPDLVLGYETSREAQNLWHQLIDGGSAVTLLPDELRAGTLRLFYPSEADADAALRLHARPTTFTLYSDERPTIGMTYARRGSARLALDDQTRDTFAVEIGFQEIDAP